MTSAIRQIPLDTRIHHHAHDFHPIVTGLRGKAEFEIEGLGGSISANTWRQDLDTLFARISDHYIVDENAFVDELVKVLDANSEDFRRIAGKTALPVLHYDAGMPSDVVQLLPGDGPTVGSVLTRDPRITGVVFTGGTDTAQIINRALGTDVGPVIDEDARQGLTASIDRLNESFAEEITK